MRRRARAFPESRLRTARVSGRFFVSGEESEKLRYTQKDTRRISRGERARITSWYALGSLVGKLIMVGMRRNTGYGLCCSVSSAVGDFLDYERERRRFFVRKIFGKK